MYFIKRITLVVFNFSINVLLLFIVLTFSSKAQIDLERIKSLWDNGEYDKVYDELIDYRDSINATLEIDYMIATSACRIPGKWYYGSIFFNWILAYYDLPQLNENIIISEMNQCTGQTNLSPPDLTFAELRIQEGGGGIFSGKLRDYKSFDNLNAPVATRSFKIIRSIPTEEFNRRLFKLDQVGDALDSLKKRTDYPYTYAYGNFILCNKNRNPDLKDLGVELQKALVFYCAKYEIEPPEYFITVYVTDSGNELRDLAERIHGVRIPQESCIGYSFHDDLSMAAIMISYPGTFRHELFHLLSRNNFGDIPAWLDEGISALYEVSSFKYSNLVGEDNWRADILTNHWGAIPHLARLLTMNYSEFNDEYGNFVNQAVNHATARYFAYYLQENGKLAETYIRFRNRNPLQIIGDPRDDTIRVIEEIFGGITIDEINTKFMDWCYPKTYEYSQFYD